MALVVENMSETRTNSFGIVSVLNYDTVVTVVLSLIMSVAVVVYSFIYYFTLEVA